MTPPPGPGVIVCDQHGFYLCRTCKPGALEAELGDLVRVPTPVDAPELVDIRRQLDELTVGPTNEQVVEFMRTAMMSYWRPEWTGDLETYFAHVLADVDQYLTEGP